MAEKQKTDRTRKLMASPRLTPPQQRLDVRMRAQRRERQKMEGQPIFSDLKSQLERAKDRYRPTQDGVAHGCLARGDADLYPSLLVLARDGLKAVQQFDPYFLTHDLYDDGMFWYGLCCFISGAAIRVEADHAEAYIPAATIDELLDILCQMSRYSGGGDIANRMLEAHAETLIGFYSVKRLRAVRAFAATATGDAKRHLKAVVAAVVAHRPPQKSPAHRKRR